MRTRALASIGLVTLLALLAPSTPAPADTGPRVLRVGLHEGVQGQFRHIQDAVDAAHPGDWILVGEGDYHETAWGGLAGVYVTTPRLHIRGMDRNRVMVDGTLPGSPRCSSDPANQDYGPPGENGEPQGRNGIWIFKASGVSVENLSACNFLSSADGEGGNQIWWDGGDGEGSIGLHAWLGRYLSATTTYYDEADPHQAMYGIFTVNSDGPGLLDQGYAGNMADSGVYIGACPDCNAVLDHLHAQNNAVGYSGTNSGGHLLVQNSEWDHNRSGVVPNSLNNDDLPSPQDGACPNGDPGPLGTGSCTVFRHNYVHHNNNPNTPTTDTTALVPIGTGFEFPGASNNTILNNLITHNGGWGVLIHDFPDTETPPPGAHCQGGTQIGNVCFFEANGNEVAGNLLRNNGFFGNPGNVDLGNEGSNPLPGNCFHDNTDPAGLTSDPPLIQEVDGHCDGPSPGDPTLAGQIVCASGLVDMGFPGFQCPGPANYPQRTVVRLGRLHPQLTMRDPCAGVPVNPWCPSGVPAGPAMADQGTWTAADIGRSLRPDPWRPPL